MPSTTGPIQLKTLDWKHFLVLTEQLLTTARRCQDCLHLGTLGRTGGRLLLKAYEQWEAVKAAVRTAGLAESVTLVNGTDQQSAAARALCELVNMDAPPAPSVTDLLLDVTFVQRLQRVGVTVELVKEAIAGTAPTGTDPPRAPLPEYMDWRDLAKALGLRAEPTRKKLERLAKKYDCFIENESPRRGDTKRLYRTADVLPYLQS